MIFRENIFEIGLRGSAGVCLSTGLYCFWGSRGILIVGKSWALFPTSGPGCCWGVLCTHLSSLPDHLRGSEHWVCRPGRLPLQTHTKEAVALQLQWVPDSYEAPGKADVLESGLIKAFEGSELYFSSRGPLNRMNVNLPDDLLRDD